MERGDRIEAMADVRDSFEHIGNPLAHEHKGVRPVAHRLDTFALYNLAVPAANRSVAH